MGLRVKFDRILNELREADGTAVRQVSGFGDDTTPFDLIARTLDSSQGYTAKIKIFGLNTDGYKETLSFQCDLYMNYIDSSNGYTEVKNCETIVTSLDDSATYTRTITAVSTLRVNFQSSVINTASSGNGSGVQIQVVNTGEQTESEFSCAGIIVYIAMDGLSGDILFQIKGSIGINFDAIIEEYVHQF